MQHWGEHKTMGMIIMNIKRQLREHRVTRFFIGLSLILIWLTPAFGQPPPEKEAELEAGFYYTVKEGDTLWDISQRFNDTPWQWPDLWRENVQLPNPHWIYPGERIRLYRKSDKQAYESKAEEVAPPIEVPEVKPEAPPVQFYYSRMSRIGFIRKPPVNPVGEIFKTQGDKQLVSVNDIIYIRSPVPGGSTIFAPGERFTIYRTMKPTDERFIEETLGTQHYLLGVVEITQSEPKYAIAKVVEAFRAVHAGDLLMTFEAQTPDVQVVPSTPGIKASLINSEDHTKLIGSGVVAFIDKGEEDSIRPGQEYNICYQETVKGNDGESLALAPVKLGSLIVLRTEKLASTVYVTNAQGKIEPGQLVLTP